MTIEFVNARLDRGPALFTRASGVCVCVKVLVIQLCPTSIDCSPPASSVILFSRQEYWSGLPFLSPGDLYAGSY